MTVKINTTHQKHANSHPYNFDAETLFSIEDLIGSRLLERIAQGGARSRPVGIPRERRGYVPQQLSKRA